MRAYSLLATLAFVLGSHSCVVFAHEGPHGPTTKMAPNGGKLQQSTNLSFELLKDEAGVKVFAYTHESLESDKKPLSPSEVIVVVKKSSLTNSKKKNVDFRLEPEEDHFKLTFNGGGSYYDFKLVANYKGKEEKAVKWRFEP